MKIEIRKNQDGWVKGDFHIYGRSFEFSALLFDLPSQYGINGGRISKLSCKEYQECPEGFFTPKGGTRIYRDHFLFTYDRGWDGKAPESMAGEIVTAIVFYLEATQPAQEVA